VKVEISDSLGWGGFSDTFTCSISDTVGIDSILFFNIDQGIPVGEINKITLNASSFNYPDQLSNDSIYIVVYYPKLSKIELYPDTLELTKGDEWQFEPLAFDQYDKPISAEYIWSCTGGEIDDNGHFKANELGLFTVIVKDVDQNYEAKIVVLVGDKPYLNDIIVIPEEIYLFVDSIYQFEAYGMNQYNTPFFFTPIWSVDGGIIDVFGKYTATEEGQFTLIAYNSDSTIWTKVTINVIPVGTVETIYEQQKIILYQNHPNPFEDETTIKFKLQNSGRITLNIYDIMGKKQSVLIDNWYKEGTHEVKFKSAAMNPGIYFYELRQGDISAIKKMMIL
jgi:hypothetical protein